MKSDGRTRKDYRYIAEFLQLSCSRKAVFLPTFSFRRLNCFPGFTLIVSHNICYVKLHDKLH